ncbi:hypothetical protein A1D22_09505 [Pasteurellaceae bacterium LFhippo2]|nr:hypothetical protein [Pasteurellaceae bacterium LFhippo2]
MFKLITSFIEKGFGKTMIVALLIAVVVNAFLCYERKALQVKVQSQQSEIKLLSADNHNLANQVENAQIQILQYQNQVNTLHKNVLAKMKQAEQRNNEILHELANHKHWADGNVPDAISRLLKQRADHSLPTDKTEPANLPNGRSVPTAPVTN